MKFTRISGDVKIPSFHGLDGTEKAIHFHGYLIHQIQRITFMSWYFRTSIKFGAGRLTFSKSGVSYSVGARGARITTGPRGTYVCLGLHGIRYQQRISPTLNYRPHPIILPAQQPELFVHTITSGAIDELTDSDSKAFVDELNEKATRISYFRWFCVIPAVISVVFLCSYFSQDSKTEEKTNYFIVIDSAEKVNVREEPDKKSEILGSARSNQSYVILDTINKGWNKIKYGDASGYISKQFSRVDSMKTLIKSYSRFETDTKDLVSLIIIGVAFFTFIGIVFHKQDKNRLLVEIYYEIDDHVKEIYDKFLRHFAELLDSQKVWQYLHTEQTADYKHNAGAGNIISRISVKRISPDHMPARFFRTNISIPNIKLRNTDLYFFPERLIIKRDGQFAAIYYKHLHIYGNETIFIEENGVPSDAQVVDYTWKFLNKDGSPDRRFNNNRRLPKCLYSEYHISSGTGVNEVITVSRKRAFDGFAHIIKAIGQFQRAYTENR
jgi:uncharacterized protein DUF4236/SH3 domain-containing protein